ncbi:acetoacetate--CoA ligase [Vibrio natriegens]|uniref:Acetoacetate-CoA ligase n=1 Tax=Vibrio natriegens NBRC 15636 = ATCC 14048 = DSM 759 TaxID=1219067 RepID=A0AAN1CXA8_VIBNA|nr:acetoacetate--CoA ligase [Vibrio natriegens]ALR18664.1 acetoacetyl-CoA synthetase [Vibrio natriegens NBRC 15636 = ATCC 14048 = DSM 759]ANQ14632.1 acetoacetate-CoA ligase [Vibrio natriegens NBRC 15636 = ATCC 14048 = DSM 759]EPM39668.1 acetoacetyl-CoA synthetase [Vibrio natriegens NBRC 15636 = ATCC 14048 = DSM 759]MDX6028406.1 acetoacetate--CoA ligase [Vibrio natriegens NBRC 15636 = ATCC 14048 = DSM 759]UUI13265.1 acetoacetate--CoA ligase [Vibrio natriegens]
MREYNKLWQPSESRIEEANITQFIEHINRQGNDIKNYAELHQWSLDHSEQFWQEVWLFCDVIGNSGDTVTCQAESRWQQPVPNRDTSWFPDAQINYAENLLSFAYHNPNDIAIWFENERGERQTYTWQELCDEVSSIQRWLQDCGVRKGDVVAGYLPYLPQTVIAMLATTSLGATWTATSPDFGIESVLERFGQVKPKVLFTCDGYTFNGKVFDMTDKNHHISDHLDGLKHVCQINYLNPRSYECDVCTQDWQYILNQYPPQPVTYTRINFNDPLFILYSSGTTGKPKCIVHSVGGTLLNHVKEHQLHCDIQPEDRVFYYTTCGWMMWNWHVSTLASGACLVIFDGSPMYPNYKVLWDLAKRADVSLFGTSAKYLEAMEKAGYSNQGSDPLPSLKTICSTGSVLYPEQFDYVYQHLKEDVHLASISGGTDICGCFVLGNPISPVYRGECQCAGLGVDTRVFSPQGEDIIGNRGELVCANSIPNFPAKFWDDSGVRYHNAYWDKFENVWHHGDDVERNASTGGYLFYGRSDTTLNPGGVRIGTAEIYQQVNSIEGIVDSIAVGKEVDRNEQIWLFVQLATTEKLNDDMIAKIKAQLKSACSARHVPSEIFSISDIPKTRSGKLVELAVKQVINGREVENIGAIANAHVLDEIKKLVSA